MVCCCRDMDLRRYCVLLAFAVVTFSNAWLWITYSPIEQEVSEYWGVSAEAVNQLSTVFMFTYVLLGFPALYLMSTRGLQFGLRIGAVLTFLGALIRFSHNSFLFAYLGSFTASLGQCFTLAIPPLLSTNWFPSNERSFATGVGVVANQLGTAVGLGVTGLIVKDASKDLRLYLGLQCIASFVGAAMVFYFVEDMPKQPPSRAAMVKESLLREEIVWSKYTETIKDLLCDRDVRLVTVAYGLSTAVFYAIATLLVQLLNSDWDASSSGALGLVVVVVGLAGSLLGGYLLDQTRDYQGVTRAFYLGATLSLVLWCLTLAYCPSSRPLAYAAAGLVGFTLTGNICTGFEFVVELTYPVDESTSAGLLNWSAQVLGCLMIWMGEYLLSSLGVLWVDLMLVLGILAATWLVCVCVDNRHYKREAAELGDGNHKFSPLTYSGEQ